MADVRAVEESVRTHLRESHGDVLEAVGSRADAVAAGWPRESTTDRSRVVGPLQTELREHGLLARFPGVLADAATAAGYDLPARPVAAPPYVVVTSRGPVLRATVADGRLVVRFEVFSVEHDPAVRYARADGVSLAVEFHPG